MGSTTGEFDDHDADPERLDPSGPDAALRASLSRAQRLGVLGPTDIDEHLTHARHFLAALPDGPGRVLDLGSGAGLPGLVITAARPDLQMALLDAQDKRVALLRDAVAAMGAADRVQVLHGRAEELARRPELRGSFDTVTARLFGPPAVVAECGAPFLTVGGTLLVSEPPDGQDRWPTDGLRMVGLERDARSTSQLTVLSQRQPCPDAYPRRVGIPAKRPLF